MFNLNSIIQIRDLIVMFIIYLWSLGLHVFSFDLFCLFVSGLKGKISLLIMWMDFIIINNVFVLSYYKVFTHMNLTVEVAPSFFSTLANFTFIY